MIMQVVILSFAVLFASCSDIQNILQPNHSLLLCKEAVGNMTDCFTFADSFIDNYNDTDPLQQKVRGCTNDEPYFRLSYLMLLLLTGLLSLAATNRLHHLTDYRNMFEATKKSTNPIVHRSVIFKAIKEKDAKFLKEVLDETEDKAAVLERTDRAGDSPLHLAAKGGSEEVIAVLVGAKANMEEKNSDGDLPLHLAVKGCSEEVAAVLLGARAELDVPDSEGRTALSLASSLPCLDLLLEAGAT